MVSRLFKIAASDGSGMLYEIWVSGLGSAMGLSLKASWTMIFFIFCQKIENVLVILRQNSTTFREFDVDRLKFYSMSVLKILLKYLYNRTSDHSKWVVKQCFSSFFAK